MGQPIPSERVFFPDDGAETFVFPATPQQQQLWFLDQLDPGNPAYNIPLAYELAGDLDADALDRSFDYVIGRHEALRTVLVLHEEELTQVVTSRVRACFTRVDLSGVPDDERDVAWRRAVASAAAQRFDLGNGPLVRGNLLHLGRERHVLILNFHHVILDHRSVLQFGREFCEAYRSFRRGGVPDLGAPPLQYPDFSVWQGEQFESPTFKAELRKWVEDYEGVETQSTIPGDRVRPSVQRFAGKEVEFSFSPRLSARIRELARSQKRTVYVTLLTLFKCLIARYSGQDDVTVGSPFSNRMVSDLEGVMGCCMNTLPLRSRLSDAESFIQAMELVHESVLSAFSRQSVPLKLIVDALHPVRDPGMNPLFQGIFTCGRRIRRNPTSFDLRVP